MRAIPAIALLALLATGCVHTPRSARAPATPSADLRVGAAAVDLEADDSMILGGMGPVHNPATSAGKLFAGLYALYCGLVVIVATGAFLVPVLHRAMHLFHWRRDHAK